MGPILQSWIAFNRALVPGCIMLTIELTSTQDHCGGIKERRKEREKERKKGTLKTSLVFI